jgi:hypothetical protein
MAQKELFINSVRSVRIDGQTVTPTAVLYQDASYQIGHEAIENADQKADLREDFKVEIGSAAPAKLAQRRSSDGNSRGRSTLGIAKDFIDAEVQSRSLKDRATRSRPGS